MADTSFDSELIQTLFNHSSIGIIVVNAKAEIIMMNPFALKQFGYEAATELKGKKIEVLIPQRYHQKHKGHHQKYMQAPKSRPMGIGLDLHGVKKNGDEFPLEISLGNYELDGERYVMAFINDITLRKETDAAIVKLNAELEQKVEDRTNSLQQTVEKLNRQINENIEKDKELRSALEREKELSELKSRFVSVASHEFRTPLSTVLSSTYLLQKYVTGEDQPKREKHIQRIISSVNLLTDILNDFLNVGRIEEGKIQVRIVTADVAKVIHETINELQTIRKPSQQIIYDAGNAGHWELDTSMFKHIIINLLSNAIKFSPDGSEIKLSTAVKNNELVLRVKDNGIGIPPEDQEHLFERFFRATNAINIQGTGLGLHIVAKYAELMNGTIACNSEPGKGSEFVITFKK
ncbi:MAG: PAS domain-containing sensor histidine kinase [Chitinophagaceae bacterium]|nr:PAS domain-containing sensor histidine kinase [Chitinophagaceae bacterium]